MGAPGQGQVVRDDARRRYELFVDGRVVGYAAFREEPGRLVLARTEILPDRRGAGLGHELLGAVLADVRARGAHVVPECGFVRSYLEEHPEDRDLLADDAT